MTHYTRTNWRARPPRGDRVKLDPDQVEGIALHWPGMQQPIGRVGVKDELPDQNVLKRPLRKVDEVMAALRSWQNYHMDAKGWSDIAYQVAIDQAGNSYVLRGHRHRSAANGDQDLNNRFGAILLIVAEGEQPTPELLETTRRQIARHRHIFPGSTLIVGHGDIRRGDTACPGRAVTRLIRADRFNPTPTKEPVS